MKYDKWQAAKRLREAQGWEALRLQKMEDGTYPSCVYNGRRVEADAIQDHPLAGERVLINDHGLGKWVLRSEVTDLRGSPRVVQVK